MGEGLTGKVQHAVYDGYKGTVQPVDGIYTKAPKEGLLDIPGIDNQDSKTRVAHPQFRDGEHLVLATEAQWNAVQAYISSLEKRLDQKQTMMDGLQIALKHQLEQKPPYERSASAKPGYKQPIRLPVRSAESVSLRS